MHRLSLHVLASPASEAERIATCPEPAETAGPKSDTQAQARNVDRIMEILREAGYHCELLQELPDNSR
jgi:hypothetical protein